VGVANKEGQETWSIVREANNMVAEGIWSIAGSRNNKETDASRKLEGDKMEELGEEEQLSATQRLWDILKSGTSGDDREQEEQEGSMEIQRVEYQIDKCINCVMKELLNDYGGGECTCRREESSDTESQEKITYGSEEETESSTNGRIEGELENPTKETIEEEIPGLVQISDDEGEDTNLSDQDEEVDSHEEENKSHTQWTEGTQMDNKIVVGEEEEEGYEAEKETEIRYQVSWRPSVRKNLEQGYVLAFEPKREVRAPVRRTQSRQTTRMEMNKDQEYEVAIEHMAKRILATQDIQHLRARDTQDITHQEEESMRRTSEARRWIRRVMSKSRTIWRTIRGPEEEYPKGNDKINEVTEAPGFTQIWGEICFLFESPRRSSLTKRQREATIEALQRYRSLRDNTSHKSELYRKIKDMIKQQTQGTKLGKSLKDQYTKEEKIEFRQWDLANKRWMQGLKSMRDIRDQWEEIIIKRMKQQCIGQCIEKAKQSNENKLEEQKSNKESGESSGRRGEYRRVWYTPFQVVETKSIDNEGKDTHGKGDGSFKERFYLKEYVNKAPVRARTTIKVKFTPTPKGEQEAKQLLGTMTVINRLQQQQNSIKDRIVESIQALLIKPTSSAKEYAKGILRRIAPEHTIIREIPNIKIVRLPKEIKNPTPDQRDKKDSEKESYVAHVKQENEHKKLIDNAINIWKAIGDLSVAHATEVDMGTLNAGTRVKVHDTPGSIEEWEKEIEEQNQKQRMYAEMYKRQHRSEHEKQAHRTVRDITQAGVTMVEENKVQEECERMIRCWRCRNKFESEDYEVIHTQDCRGRQTLWGTGCGYCGLALPIPPDVYATEVLKAYGVLYTPKGMGRVQEEREQPEEESEEEEETNPHNEASLEQTVDNARIHKAIASESNRRESKSWDPGTDATKEHEKITREHLHTNADKTPIQLSQPQSLTIIRAKVDNPPNQQTKRKEMADTQIHFDRGSTINCASMDFVKSRGYKIELTEKTVAIEGVGGTEHTNMMCKLRIDMTGPLLDEPAEMGRITLYTNLMVSKTLGIPILIGAPTLMQINAIHSNDQDETLIGKEEWGVRITMSHMPWETSEYVQRAAVRHALGTEGTEQYDELIGMIRDNLAVEKEHTNQTKKKQDKLAARSVSQPWEGLSPIEKFNRATLALDRFKEYSTEEIVKWQVVLELDDEIITLATLQYLHEGSQLFSITEEEVNTAKTVEMMKELTRNLRSPRKPLTLRQSEYMKYCQLFITAYEGITRSIAEPSIPIDLPEGPVYMEPDLQAVIDDWNSEIQDSIEGMSEVTHRAGEQNTIERPKYIPQDIWEKIPANQLEKVHQRWERYSDERREFILKDIVKLDVCKERPLQSEYIKALCWANIDAFYHIDAENPPTVPNTMMRIITYSERPTVSRRQQQFTPLEKAFLEVKTRTLVKLGQIEESTSPYRAPISLVQYPDRVKAFMEKHGERAMEALKEPENEAEVATFYRLTIDLRLLNNETVADKHPLPRTNDVINALKGNKHYSCFDIQDAFWCIALDKEDMHKTAFATHHAHYHWRVMPQGGKNSAVVWARLIRQIFTPSRQGIEVYQDDVFNCNQEFRDHMETMQATFDRLREHKLVFKRSKAKLNYPRIKCLGHIITERGRVADPSMVQAVLDFKIPRSKKQVQVFLGMANYNRDYIRNISELTADLQSLTHNDIDVPTEWKDEIHGKAFRNLKQAFIRAPILQLPDFSKPFRIEVDGCTTHGRGIGAVLTQQNDQGVYRPIAYFSKMLTPRERIAFSATAVEAKALHDSIMHWAAYLSNGIPFEVVVDHRALVYLVTAPTQTANRRLLRYVLDLQGFNFSVIYQKGTKHLQADAVSRLFQYGDTDQLDEEDEPETSFDIVDQDTIMLLLRTLSTDYGGIDKEDVLEKQEENEQEKQKAICRAMATTYLDNGCEVRREDGTIRVEYKTTIHELELAETEAEDRWQTPEYQEQDYTDQEYQQALIHMIQARNNRCQKAVVRTATQRTRAVNDHLSYIIQVQGVLRDPTEPRDQWENMEGRRLIEKIKDNCESIAVLVKDDEHWTTDEAIEWCQQFIGPHITYIEEDSSDWEERDDWEKGTILIHTNKKLGQLWEERGGIFIHHEHRRQSDEDECIEESTGEQDDENKDGQHRIRLNQIGKDYRMVENTTTGEAWIEKLPNTREEDDAKLVMMLNDQAVTEWKLNKLLRELEDMPIMEVLTPKEINDWNNMRERRVTFDTTITQEQPDEILRRKRQGNDHNGGRILKLEPMTNNPNSYRDNNFQTNTYRDLQNSDSEDEELERQREIDETEQKSEGETQDQQDKIIIYCDLDGVLTDFKWGLQQFLSKQNKGMVGIPLFYARLPMIPSGKELWDMLMAAEEEVQILTGRNTKNQSFIVQETKLWVEQYLGGHIKVNVTTPHRKHEYSGPNRILIDDNESLGHKWEQKGGIFIHHTQTEKTIKRLQDLGIQKKNDRAITNRIQSRTNEFERLFQEVMQKAWLVDQDLGEEVVVYDVNTKTLMNCQDVMVLDKGRVLPCDPRLPGSLLLTCNRQGKLQQLQVHDIELYTIQDLRGPLNRHTYQPKRGCYVYHEESNEWVEYQGNGLIQMWRGLGHRRGKGTAIDLEIQAGIYVINDGGIYPAAGLIQDKYYINSDEGRIVRVMKAQLVNQDEARDHRALWGKQTVIVIIRQQQLTGRGIIRNRNTGRPPQVELQAILQKGIKNTLKSINLDIPEGNMKELRMKENLITDWNDIHDTFLDEEPHIRIMIIEVTSKDSVQLSAGYEWRSLQRDREEPEVNWLWEVEQGIPISWNWNEDEQSFMPAQICRETHLQRQEQDRAIVQMRTSSRERKSTERLQAWKKTIRQPRVSNSMMKESSEGNKQKRAKGLRRQGQSEVEEENVNNTRQQQSQTLNDFQQGAIQQEMEEIQASTGIRVEKDMIERIQRRAMNMRKRRRSKMRPTVVDTSAYLRNRNQPASIQPFNALIPIDNVPTHLPVILGEPEPVQQEGESNKQFQDRQNQHHEFVQARENFHRQKEEEASRYDYLIGRCFIHPNTKRLYEVVRIYWNRRLNEYAAYRQPIDGELALDEDRYSFSVEGFNGVKELTHRYSNNAGDMEMLCSWPQTEREMLKLQQQDPICSGVIEKIKLQTETRPEMLLYQGDSREGGMQYYQPALSNQEKGAVRVKAKVMEIEKAVGRYMTEEEDEQGMGQLRDDPTYLPYQLINAVLRYYHDAMGHSGLERLHMSLKLKYFWINMYADVKRYVTSCRQCKLRKAGRTQAKVPLQTLNIPLRPFQRVYIDLIVCKPSARGYQYICVMQDALTKWIELVPLKDKTATTVAQAITENITLRHGSIDHLVTDKGSEFRNFTMQELNYITRTRHHMSTTANPQANLVERLNGVLKDMLAMFVHKNQADWDIYIPVVAHGYRTTVNSVTGYSPFRMLYGREAKLPTESWIEKISSNSDWNLSQYVHELTKALMFCWGQGADLILQRAVQAKDRLQQHLDANVHMRLFRPFMVGQRFYLKTIPKRYFYSEEDKIDYKLSASLQYRYTGPHQVLHVINPVIYVAAVDGTLRFVHANKMKRESHNDEDIEVKIDRLRVSTFLNKPPLQQEQEKVQGQLEKYIEETVENRLPQIDDQEPSGGAQVNKEAVIEIDDSDDSSNEGDQGYQEHSQGEVND